VNLAQKVLLNTSALTLGRITLAASGLVGVAISTRYLGAETYGSLAIATVFISLAMLATDLGIYTIATREIARDRTQEQRVLRNVLGMALVLTAGAIVLSLVAMLILYGGEDRDLVRLGILILLAQMMIAPPAGNAAAYLNTQQRAVPLMVGAVAGSTIFLLAVGAAVIFDWGFAGIAAAQAIGAVVGGLLPVAAARPALRLQVEFDLALWRKLIGWALPQGGIIILGTLYFRIDLVLLSLLRSDAEVALYAAAYKVVEVLTVLPLLFMFTLFPELARTTPRSPRLKEIVQIASTAMQLLALPVAVYFMVFAEPVIEIVGGPEFADAAPVLRILMISAALVFPATVFFNALVALGRQKTLFWFLLAVLAVNIPLNFVLIPVAGAQGAAISVAISELAALLLVLRIFRGVGDLPRVHRPLASLLATAAGTAAALAVLALAEPLGAVAVLLAGALLGGLAFAGVLVALRAVPGEVLDLIDTVRRREPPPDEPADPGAATAGAPPSGPSLGR